MELNGKVAVITGGSGGIGRAMARAFLAEGAKAVMLADLDAAAVASAARELGCDGMACDVTDEAQVDRARRAHAASSTVRSTCSAPTPALGGRAC